LSSGTFHIFFPPRLEIVVDQQQPDGFSPYFRNEAAFYRFLGHQTDSPTGMACGRVAADHGDDALLFGGLQQVCRARTLFVIQRLFQTRLLVTASDLAQGLGGKRDQGGDLGRRSALSELLKCQGAKNGAHRLYATSEQGSQFVLIRLFEAHVETPISPHAPV
jgi:hypothetical protein